MVFATFEIAMARAGLPEPDRMPSISSNNASHKPASFLVTGCPDGLSCFGCFAILILLYKPLWIFQFLKDPETDVRRDRRIVRPADPFFRCPGHSVLSRNRGRPASPTSRPRAQI